jgi:hypothetical protein
MTDHKYNPNRHGNANKPHKNPKYYINGVYLLYGSGCKIGGNDCFNCRLPDCMWDSGSNENDMNGRQQCTT